MTANNTNLLFVDLETTGLDANRDVILEIAALPVDQNLNVLHKGWSTVISHPTVAPLPTMNDLVKQMHTENGLLTEIASGGLGIQTAQRVFLGYAEQFCLHGQTPLAGSSVHFDRKFLAQYMPGVDKFFHYRIADVSVIKEFWKRWFPDAGEPPKVKAHRALADCYESVTEARWYRDRLRLTGGPLASIADRDVIVEAADLIR